MVRKIHAVFAEKNLYMLDSPVSGGPSGAASGKMAIWVGGDEQIFNRHKLVLDAMGDQAAYIGPIGASSIGRARCPGPAGCGRNRSAASQCVRGRNKGARGTGPSWAASSI
jgi:6-phosphogluconate dehydrogenase (decarboxylating)